MASYIALADLKTRVGSNVSSTNPGRYQQLTDPVNGTTGNDTLGQAWLDAASAIIDLYTSGKHGTPATVTTGSAADAYLKSVCVDLWLWKAYTEAGPRETIPRSITSAYESDLEQLEQIRECKMTLPGLDVAGEFGDAEIGSLPRVFTESELTGL